jgi:hypothetical protein
MRVIVIPSTLIRLGAISVLAAGAICGTAVLAAPAHAAGGCQLESYIVYVTNDGPPEVVASAVELCGGTHFDALPVTLSKNGVAVAVGDHGSAYYVCTGTTTSTYTDQWGSEISAPCS